MKGKLPCKNSSDKGEIYPAKTLQIKRKLHTKRCSRFRENYLIYQI
jgi:hypothetical protein